MEDTRSVAHIPLSDSARQIKQQVLALPYLKRRLHLREQYPRFIYRYLSDQLLEEHLSDYIVDSFFWLSSPSKFNDPFDMAAQVIVEGKITQRIDSVRQKVNQNFAHLPWKERQKIIYTAISDKNFSATVVSSFRKNIEKIGVVCFSKDPRNLLMWSHYANHHRGLVLQFEIASDFESLPALLEVEYKDDYPIVNWLKNSSKDFVAIMGRKHPHWGYEEEMRIVIVDGAQKYLPFRPEALTGVIMGCRADETFKERVLNLLKIRAHKAPRPVKIYNAIQHPKKYKIMLERVHSY